MSTVEEDAIEVMADQIYGAASQAGVEEDAKLDEMVLIVLRLLNEAYSAGYQDGQYDERLAQDYRRQKDEEFGPVGEAANDRLANEKYED